MRRILLACASAAVLAASPSARADDDDLLRGPRIEVVPSLGVGMATFTSPVAGLPSTVGMSVASLELGYDSGGRWGGFARGGFFSSGDSGRWVSPHFALGATYRLVGDGEETYGFVLRGGIIWERWHGSQSGCDIPFVYPESCKDETPPPTPGVIVATVPDYDTTIDTGGLFFGARVELPVSFFYLGVGAEVTGTADFTQSSPGAVFTGQLTFSFAFRNHQSDNGIAPSRETRKRLRGW